MNRPWLLSIAVLMCAICISILSRPPQPTTIESARNSTELKEKIAAFGPSGCAWLGFALGFDYLFMAAYATAIGLGCATVADDAGLWLHRVGMIVAYAQIAGALIDATENATLIHILVNGFDERLMSIARLATAAKFTIPLTGITYILIVWPVKHWWKF
jgi:hypothetical protein